MAKPTGNRGMAHDGWSTRNFQDIGKSLSSGNFQDLLRPTSQSSVPVTPSAPVGQQGSTPAPQPPARTQKE